MKLSELVKISHELHSLNNRVRWKIAINRKGIDSCRDIENEIRLIAGVKDVSLNWRAKSLVISFNHNIISKHELLTALNNLTIHLRKSANANIKHSEEAPSINRTLGNLALLAVGNRLPPSLSQFLTYAASTPLFFQAIGDLVKNGLTSHVLEGLAVGVSTAQKDFTAANTTLFMLSLGEYLEESIVRRSDDMLRSMLRPISDDVWIIDNKKEKLVKIEDVKIGDKVLCNAGTIIPIDGTVLTGLASVDESSMTGESIGQKKERGSRVLSGTLVESGTITIYAEQVGKNTAVSRVAEYVEKSLSNKCGTQLEAMNLAEKMVPWVMALAGGTYLVSNDFKRVAAVLQADYSCVLKLAVPVAMKSAMYEAGKNHILIKGASSLESLSRVDTFVFDKTGTLTEGVLEVTDAVTFSKNFSSKDLIALTASLEEHYFHPLASAIVTAAKNIGAKHFDHSEVNYIIAHGLVSEVNKKKVVIGSRHFLEDHESIKITKTDQLKKFQEEGKSLMYIAYDGKLIGILALRDKIRLNAKSTIEKLKKIGVKNIIMLTGDDKRKAKEIALELGIDRYYAELQPEEKASIIEVLSNEGKTIAFVGDGINDGPALAGATVGIAMKKGADIARMTADIALMDDNIDLIVTSKIIANNVMKQINDNQKLTFVLNSSILGLASFGILSPAASSVLHNGSTIGVLLKAMKSKKNIEPLSIKN